MLKYAAGLAGILLALPALAETIVLEGQTLQTVGTIIEVTNGDSTCLLKLKDDKAEEFFAPADFKLCNPELVGKRVRLTYAMGNVMAESCRGDITCKKSDRIAAAVDAKPL